MSNRVAQLHQRSFRDLLEEEDEEDEDEVKFQSVLELSPSRVETPNPVRNLAQADLTNHQQESNQLINVTVYHDVADNTNTSAWERHHEDSIIVDDNYVEDFEEISRRVSSSH